MFEARAVIELLSQAEAREYLVELLGFFVRTNTGYVYWKERGTWHRRKVNDTDLDDMIALAGMVEAEHRPRYLKRVAADPNVAGAIDLPLARSSRKVGRTGSATASSSFQMLTTKNSRA